MAFSGWSDRAVAFYAGLEADNSRAYFTANRAVYDADVLEPMQELVAELEARFGHAKIFRPQRDVRFSKDKTPYRTGIGVRLGDAFIRLSAAGLFAGGGSYHMEADQLARFRDALVAEPAGAALDAIVEALEGQGLDVRRVDPLKTAPRGYPADHPRIELLRAKGLFAAKEWPVEPWLATPVARDRIVAVLDQTGPLRAWFAEHVGATTVLPRRSGRG